MRTTEERDEQTVAIAAALLMVVVCVGLSGVVLWLADRAVDVGEAAWPAAFTVSLGVGCVLAVRHLRGR
jgi:hypothetical protein